MRKKTKEIREGLSALAEQIGTGDESELLLWLIPGQLACAHRPLRYHRDFGGSGKNLPNTATKAVLAWVKRIKGYGIKSIICLMHSKELHHYDTLDLGARDLLQLYQQYGFEVCHIPWQDPAHIPASEKSCYQDELRRVRLKALDEFGNLPKPILLHCSAGQDRSAPVAAYIVIQKQTE